MTLIARCDDCSYERKVARRLAGRRFRCPSCRQGALEVPGAESAPVLECAGCGALIPGDEGAGKRVCPACEAEQDFSASAVEPIAVTSKTLAKAADKGLAREARKAAAKAEPAPSRLPSLLMGLALGVVLALGLASGLRWNFDPVARKRLAAFEKAAGDGTPAGGVSGGAGAGDSGGESAGDPAGDSAGAKGGKPGTDAGSATGGEDGGEDGGESGGSATGKTGGSGSDPTGGDTGGETDGPRREKKVIEREFVRTATGSYPIAVASELNMEGKIFTVKEVVDGDTMHLQELPNHAKVRLLGVDTPETKHATKGLQFWGKEASAFTKKTLNGQQVVAHIDMEHLYGVFGRPLVYLELVDGRDFNGMLIRQGYARVTREYPFDRMEAYKKLEEKAKAEKLGMWNAEKRAEWDAARAAEREAEKRRKEAARQAELARREQRVKEAEAKGGRYIHAPRSKVLHEPWCPRRPSKAVDHTDDLEGALKSGYRKHTCFEDD